MKQEKIILEIRASEGGSDSKLLVADLANIYLKSAKNNDFSFEIKEDRPGFCVIWLTGKGVKKYYQNESGGHRFLRIPPTEKRGRTQTSIVTVAVTTESKFEYDFDRSKISKSYIRGTGNGGQAINKTSSCVQLVHKESGIIIKCQDTRDRSKNEEIAWSKMLERLKSIEENKYNKILYENRFDQVGDSSRSVKKRTYRVKEDIAIDHETGKSCSFKEFNKGRIELIC